MSAPEIDNAKLEAFMGQAVTDMGAIISAPRGRRALRVAERSIREWLPNQAAGGYVEYDGATDRCTLPPEQALALADEDRPFCERVALRSGGGAGRRPVVADAFGAWEASEDLNQVGRARSVVNVRGTSCESPCE